MSYDSTYDNTDKVAFTRYYHNGRIVYYDSSNRIIKIKYPNGKIDIRDYHPNGVLKYRRFPNGKHEGYTTDKKLVYRKRDNCEEIWSYDLNGKCVMYSKHVYY